MTQEVDVNERLLTTREAADYLRRSHRTLQKWRELRCGPTCIAMGNLYLYRKADLDAWVSSHEWGGRLRA